MTRPLHRPVCRPNQNPTNPPSFPRAAGVDEDAWLPGFVVGFVLALAVLLLVGLGLATCAHAATDDPGTIILRPAEPDPERRAAFAAWHRQFLRDTRPLARAVTRVRAITDLDQLHRGPAPCRDLARALIDLDRKNLVDTAPSLPLRHHLKNGLERLEAAALACLERRPRAVHPALDGADAAFAQAAAVLAPWNLDPSEDQP